MPDDSGLLTLDELPEGHEFTRAVWEGDTDWLDEHYGCGCCCNEHTFEGCAARMWGACRGQGTMTQAELDSWARHYGMTLDEFLTGERGD